MSTSYFTPDEAYFLRTTLKDGLDSLHEKRRKTASENNLVGLMKVEDQLASAEQAWQKVKGML